MMRRRSAHEMSSGLSLHCTAHCPLPIAQLLAMAAVETCKECTKRVYPTERVREPKWRLPVSPHQRCLFIHALSDCR